MAVSIPSDLVLDVMRSADPVRLQKISARFSVAQTESTEQAGAFASVVESIEGGPPAFASGNAITSFAAGKGAPSDAEGARTQKLFSQMVLRTVFESMLPQAKSGVFGSDMTADVWRSMTADQIAKVAADNGGLGLTQSLWPSAHRGTGAGPMSTSGHWPYFASGRLRGFESWEG